MAASQASLEDASPHNGPATPSRKRRRRTAATGASEDCFTCRKTQSPCDRVRPFCGQCLDQGRECSGYRTVLTWGVGVASRGKLRGMTMPVATPSNFSGETSTKDSKPEPSSAAPTAPPKPKSKPNQRDAATKRKRPSIKTEPDVEVFKPTHNESTFQPSPYPSWQMSHSSVPTPDERHRNVTSHPNADLGLDITTDGLESSSIPSLPTPTLSSSIGGASYVSSPWGPLSEVSPGSESPRFTDSFDKHDMFSPRSAIPPNPGLQHPGLPSPAASDVNLWNNGAYAAQRIPIPAELKYATSSPREDDTFWRISLSPRSNNGFETMYDDAPSNSEDEGRDRDANFQALVPSIQRSLFDVKHFHLPRRMQHLLDYYDKMICPVLVAFDDNSNPYRYHIMHLAMQNPGLQNAIAALVTNNMRMRDFKHVPRLKYDIDTNRVVGSSSPTLEEQQHKRMSIIQLNGQLANADTASDDSVLATLLILCLFHVCNTGFSKFKTQLAGVQKVLRMRNCEERSEFVGWVEMFFAWFDVMTAPVNDRETEIRGDSLDMMDWSANLGALERFSGCDGRLFKLIARLARLNLLSQGRPVRVEPYVGTQRFSKVDDDANSSDFEHTGNDNRKEFWREWNTIRARLREWRFTPAEHSQSQQANITQRSLEDISEAFRYAALLYTERLGSPSLPSSSENFQSLVRASLARIETLGVNSCVTKFMLWPMFVTGTECVDERDRQLIRERCVEIQEESGFYNNLSGLHLLERVWAQNDGAAPPSESAHPGAHDSYTGGAFRWRKLMERSDGEYIVI